MGESLGEKKGSGKATKRYMSDAFSNSTYNFDKNEILVQLGHIFLAAKHFSAGNCKKGRKISISSFFFSIRIDWSAKYMNWKKSENIFLKFSEIPAHKEFSLCCTGNLVTIL